MRDTKGAEGDLHMAREYLRQYGEVAASDFGTRGMYLDKATEYVISAREKDPDAFVTVTTNGKERKSDVDDIAGDIHYERYSIERACASIVPPTVDDHRMYLLQAKKHLEAAIELTPYYPYPNAMCDLLLDLHDQPGALKVAQEWAARNPDRSTETGRDAALLLDRIKGAPVTREPTYYEKKPSALQTHVMLASVAGIIACITLGYNIDEVFYVFAAVIFVGFWVWNHFDTKAYENKKLQKIWDDAADQFHRRK